MPTFGALRVAAGAAAAVSFLPLAAGGDFLSLAQAGGRWSSLGEGVACRLDPEGGDAGWAARPVTAASLGSCKRACEDDAWCTGVGYHEADQRCEVWTQPLADAAATGAEAKGSSCHRLARGLGASAMAAPRSLKDGAAAQGGATVLGQCAGGPGAVCECLLHCPVFGGDPAKCDQKKLNQSSHEAVGFIAKTVVQGIKDAASSCAAMGCLVKCARSLKCEGDRLEQKCRQMQDGSCGLACDM